MRSLVIIPARGGSKRIPGKNIKEFCGKPIIAYSIEAAMKAGIFDEVMVSTDSDEIADVAAKYGAKIPFMRSSETSDDYATTNQVILEVLRKYKEQGREFDCVFCIYPTAPFILPEDLIQAGKIMEENNPDEVLSVTEFSYPPQRCYHMDDKGMIEFKYKEYSETRSQDLEKLYHDAGQFYSYNVKRFIELGGNIVDNKYPVILSGLRVQDIDNIEDWKLAEIKYGYLQNRE